MKAYENKKERTFGKEIKRQGKQEKKEKEKL